MKQPIVLVATEINPGINMFLNKKELATQIPLEDIQGEVHKTDRISERRQVQKNQGLLRGKPKNTPVTQIETGNSPVQKTFYPKRAHIHPKTSINTRKKLLKWRAWGDSNPRSPD